jgi:aspartyl-tRNA(Asn)/glutamyl-tRNA(Gln) amidotransferase subunit A
MSVPGGFTKEGLPVGVQFQAAHFQEEKLFKTGFNLEQSLGLLNMKLDI